MDILTEKWYGGLPCFKMSPQLELTDVAQPRPLGVAAVAGQYFFPAYTRPLLAISMPENN